MPYIYWEPMAAGVRCLVGSLVSERSQVSGSVENAGPPMGSASSSGSPSFSLIQSQGTPASGHWLAVSIFIWFFWLLVGPLQGPTC